MLTRLTLSEKTKPEAKLVRFIRTLTGVLLCSELLYIIIRLTRLTYREEEEELKKRRHHAKREKKNSQIKKKIFFFFVRAHVRSMNAGPPDRLPPRRQELRPRRADVGPAGWNADLLGLIPDLPGRNADFTGRSIGQLG